LWHQWGVCTYSTIKWKHSFTLVALKMSSIQVIQISLKSDTPSQDFSQQKVKFYQGRSPHGWNHFQYLKHASQKFFKKSFPCQSKLIFSCVKYRITKLCARAIDHFHKWWHICYSFVFMLINFKYSFQPCPW